MKRLGVTLIAFFFLAVARQANGQTAPEKAVSLQSYNFQKFYVRHSDGLGKMSEISTALDRREAAFFLAPGLADPKAVSFRSLSSPKSYLRHQEGRVKLHPLQDDEQFKQDATFKAVKGLADPTWKSFESVNSPGHFLRHKNGELWVERNDGTPQFAVDATFRSVAPPVLPPVQTAQTIAEKGFALARPSYADITQGAAGTCWILSSIAALQARGVDLTKRIRYEGKNEYVVTLYNYNKPAARPAGGMHVTTVRVHFDGKTTAVDPAFNPRDPRSAWVVILQRAVVQAVHAWDRTQVVANPHGGWGGDALAILAGRPAQYVDVGKGNFQQAVRAAVAARKTVVFGTKDTAKTLVGNHDYAVIGLSSQGLTLYNPHGSQLTVTWNLIRNEGWCFFIMQ